MSKHIALLVLLCVAIIIGSAYLTAQRRDYSIETYRAWCRAEQRYTVSHPDWVRLKRAGLLR